MLARFLEISDTKQILSACFWAHFNAVCHCLIQTQFRKRSPHYTLRDSIFNTISERTIWLHLPLRSVFAKAELLQRNDWIIGSVAACLTVCVLIGSLFVRHYSCCCIVYLWLNNETNHIQELMGPSLRKSWCTRPHKQKKIKSLGIISIQSSEVIILY